MAEIRPFVFCVTFILIMATLVGSIPTGFSGSGTDPDLVIPVDASLITGFAETKSYCKANFTGLPITYAYNLNGRDWLAFSDGTLSTFSMGAKVYIGGVLWLGGFQICTFVNVNGTNRGTSLSATEIATDANDGQVRYDLLFPNGNTAGGLVAYWNTTANANPSNAWSEADSTKCLWFMHGTGVSENSIDIVKVLLQVLTFSLPNVPLLVNALISTSLWSAVIFIVWFLVKESLPFV